MIPCPFSLCWVLPSAWLGELSRRARDGKDAAEALRKAGLGLWW